MSSDDRRPMLRLRTTKCSKGRHAECTGRGTLFGTACQCVCHEPSTAVKDAA